MTPEIVIELTKLEEGVFEEDTLHGITLDMIQQIINLPGEYYSDQNCLRLIHRTISAWSKLED